MGDWRAFRDLRRSRSPIARCCCPTFALTVVFDLTVAVEVGLVLASLFFIYRVSELTRVDASTLDGVPPAASRRIRCSARSSSARSPSSSRCSIRVRTPARIVILEMHQVINIDNTGLETLEALHALAQRGGRLILCGLNRHPAEQVARAGLVRRRPTSCRILPRRSFRAQQILARYCAARALRGLRHRIRDMMHLWSVL